jgi:hypothetical protein
MLAGARAAALVLSRTPRFAAGDRPNNELAACKTLANACVLVQPDGWARGEREGYGGPRDVTSLSLKTTYGEPRDVTSLSLKTTYGEPRDVTSLSLKTSLSLSQEAGLITRVDHSHNSRIQA